MSPGRIIKKTVTTITEEFVENADDTALSATEQPPPRPGAIPSPAPAPLAGDVEGDDGEGVKPGGVDGCGRLLRHPRRSGC